MFRLAQETDSLLEPLQELQDRISLEVPPSYVKEEHIRESSDQQTANYVITWYTTEDADPTGDDLDVETIIESMTASVLNSKEGVEWDMSSEPIGTNTFRSSIQVKFTPTTANVLKIAQDISPAAEAPVSFYIADDVYGVDSPDQLEYRILKNGEVYSDGYDSLPDALGGMFGEVLSAVQDMEMEKGEDPNTVRGDFLLGIADLIMGDEAISEEAKEHFVVFVELLTNRDVEAYTEED